MAVQKLVHRLRPLILSLAILVVLVIRNRFGGLGPSSPLKVRPSPHEGRIYPRVLVVPLLLRCPPGKILVKPLAERKSMVEILAPSLTPFLLGPIAGMRVWPLRPIGQFMNELPN